MSAQREAQPQQVDGIPDPSTSVAQQQGAADTIARGRRRELRRRATRRDARYLRAVAFLRGQLLVAAPGLVDPNFRRAVVLVTEHSADGAMGLVLNRPTDSAVDDVAPELGPLVEQAACVHAGGPVSPDAVVVVAEFDDPRVCAHVILDDVGFVSADADLPTVAEAVRRARVFAGYAGWSPGQLDAELSDEGWILAPATPEDLFAPADELWSAVLRRKGGEFALVARMPLDPSLN